MSHPNDPYSHDFDAESITNADRYLAHWYCEATGEYIRDVDGDLYVLTDRIEMCDDRPSAVWTAWHDWQQVKHADCLLPGDTIPEWTRLVRPEGDGLVFARDIQTEDY